jgi:glutathione S-transferase
MIIVHHLNESRSQRILWLLEELGLDYELRSYARDATTRLAPPELKAIHPLGKSPVITDGDMTVHESAAIIDYLIRRHGGGRLQPDPQTPAYDDYVQWLHYAEGSAMLPLMLKMYTGRLGEAAAPLKPRIDSEIANHLGFVDGALAGKAYLLGDELTGADVQMSFVGEVAGSFRQREAYQAALVRGGPYSLAR